MAQDIVSMLGDLVWPLAVALAWLVGELGHRWLHLPRISLYGLVGFGLGSTQLGLLPAAGTGSMILAAHVAFGLILFEFGYRINLRWLRINPWIGIVGVLEAGATFIAAYFLARAFGMPVLAALLLASLAMSTSPAALLRVVNEGRCSGQVTERVLHLTAVNCLLSVFAFKVIVGFWTFETSGSLWQAVSGSALLLVASALLGAGFGLLVPALLRHMGRQAGEATIGFAIGVVLVVTLAHSLKLSPVLASLTFGFVARHRRLMLHQTQRNFGALGDLLAIMLFVFVASTIAWQRVWLGLGLGLALIGVRLLTKVAVVGLFARVSGLSQRKGLLTGLAMMPISVFVILLLEQARFLGIDLVDQLAPLAAATLLLELVGPLVTQRALALAGETAEPEEA